MKKVFLSLILFALATSQVAAKAPDCSQNNVGMVHCFEDRMCECKFFPASEMAQTPQRFGWDCGLERPTCLDYQDTQSSAPKYDGPSSVVIDKNSTLTGSGAITGGAVTNSGAATH